MFTCETICLPNHYLIFKKNLLFLGAFNDFHPKGSKAAGILQKTGLRKLFRCWLLIYSTYVASKISVLWACHLDSPFGLNLSQVPCLDILRRLQNKDTRLDLEWPIQGYLYRSAVSRYVRQRTFLFLCSTRWRLYHSLPVCILMTASIFSYLSPSFQLSYYN